MFVGSSHSRSPLVVPRFSVLRVPYPSALFWRRVGQFLLLSPFRLSLPLLQRCHPERSEGPLPGSNPTRRTRSPNSGCPTLPPLLAEGGVVNGCPTLAVIARVGLLLLPLPLPLPLTFETLKPSKPLKPCSSKPRSYPNSTLVPWYAAFSRSNTAAPVKVNSVATHTGASTSTTRTSAIS